MEFLGCRANDPLLQPQIGIRLISHCLQPLGYCMNSTVQVGSERFMLVVGGALLDLAHAQECVVPAPLSSSAGTWISGSDASYWCAARGEELGHAPRWAGSRATIGSFLLGAPVPFQFDRVAAVQEKRGV